MGRKANLFFEVAYSRCRSMRTSMMALEYLVGYGRALDAAEGGPIKVEDYAEFVGASRSQAFRRQAAWKRCFGADDIESTWAIVKPFLDKYDGETKSLMQQAVIVGTLTWNP